MRIIRSFVAALALSVLVTALAGCGQGGGGTTGGAKRGTEVRMKDTAFVPSELEVKVGDTVTWTNDDPVPHTVTGEGFDQTLQPGETFKREFDKSGTYDYRCTIHPGMTGRVVVK